MAEVYQPGSPSAIVWGTCLGNWPTRMSATNIGAQDLTMFFGANGPYWTDLDHDNDVSWAFNSGFGDDASRTISAGSVTIGDTTYRLPDPFLVMATQNPIEQQGTYPLPEAQIDRFMLKCKITYPSKDDERRIMNRFTKRQSIEVNTVMTSAQISALRDLMDQVYCDEKVGDYILDLVFATRKPSDYGIKIDHQIEYGASPRASLYLNLAARANAMLHGRGYATPQDVKEVAYDVLRHRIMLTYEAEAEEIESEDIITRLLNDIPVP